MEPTKPKDWSFESLIKSFKVSKATITMLYEKFHRENRLKKREYPNLNDFYEFLKIELKPKEEKK